MFTGLIERVGKIKNVRYVGGDMRLSVAVPDWAEECAVGDSVAVNGACLTVTEIENGALSMDVSAESVSRTTLGALKTGSEVNLERALRLSDRLGGHLVSGHVDGIGTIVKKEKKYESWIFRIEIAEALSRYTIEKGSIAVDGVSLTINACEKDFFEVNIIPETGKATTLLKAKRGDQVNIETDLVGKYIEKFLTFRESNHSGEKSSGIDMETLITHGFGKGYANCNDK